MRGTGRSFTYAAIPSEIDFIIDNECITNGMALQARTVYVIMTLLKFKSINQIDGSEIDPCNLTRWLKTENFTVDELAVKIPVDVSRS